MQRWQPSLLQAPRAAALLALAEHRLAARRYADALPLYRELSGINPKDPPTALHLGFCLERLQQLDEAAACYRNALALEPDFLEAHVNLAGLLWRLCDHPGSLAHAQRAVALKPDHPYAVRILGTALLHLNRLPEAEQHLRRSLELLPGFALAQLDLALVLLLAGRLPEAWPFYSHRWRELGQIQRPAFWRAELEWQGPQRQPLAGRRLLVYAEQGLGDTLQFIRYVRPLQLAGATVSALVQPALVSLLECIPGLSCFKPGVDIQADCHVALLDLPMHLGTTLDSVPAEVPYLQAPVKACQAWQARLAPWHGKFKVGLTWTGNPTHVNNRNRSLPLSALAPLLGLPGVQCFSLQKEAGNGYTDWQPQPGQLPDFTGNWTDFNDSSAMLSALDLVITVDTSIAHLAGALGKPVWLLLPPNPDWRWLLERDDSPWYPTMRLFRRDFGEPVQNQVARVVQALVQKLSAS